MHFRKRFKRLRDRVAHRLGAFIPAFAGSANPSVTSLPNIPAQTQSGLSPPLGRHSRFQSDTNIPAGPQAEVINANETVAVQPGMPGRIENTIDEAGLPSQPCDGSAAPFSWTWLQGLSRVLAGSFGPLKTIVDDLVACVDLYEGVATNREDFRTLQAELEAILEELQHSCSGDTPPTVTGTIESLCQSIQKDLNFVRGRQTTDISRRVIELQQDVESVLSCYRRIKGHLHRISLNVNLSVWKIVDEQATNSRLDRLSPALSACYNSAQATELKRGECTPGTRVEVLAQMHDWVYDRAAGTVYWLNGMAGTGKTTIAYSLCTELFKFHNLGASFFCSRSLPECRDVNRFVPSIAYQLAGFSRPYRCALSRILEAQKDVHTQLLKIQFESLVVKPLQEVRGTLPEDLVVVIDALDECDSKKSTGQILEALLTKVSDLPIKFVMASRPEPEIREQMRKQVGRSAIERMVLHELDKGTVQADIERYLRAALAPIKPSEADVTGLIERAGILFIYAATVVRYIGYANFSKNPRQRLRNVLDESSSSGSNPYKEIDKLYTLVLAAALDDEELDAKEKADTKEVLHTVLCACEPLTTSALSGLLGLHDVERIRAAIAPLWSVLHVVESSGLVATLHASFPDYMFDPARSQSYWCDKVATDHALTKHCLDCIKNTTPQFNICDLEASDVLDAQIPNLGDRIKKAISIQTSYACRYWVTHLEHAKGSTGIGERIDDFLAARLLLWMEVMNLTKNIQAGVEMMQRAEEWCRSQPCSEDLRKLAHDAWRFVTEFAFHPVSQSTPHIYVSMLPFWPESSPIAQCYTMRRKGMIGIHGTAMQRRPHAILATWAVSGEATAVAWSPRAPLIAFICDGQIYLWDSLKGRLAIGPLNETSHTVTSIGFSSDGTRLVSGSGDGAIRIWDAQTGKKVKGPLKGHKDEVGSVVFSSNDTRIASGSNDKTICVWDAHSGKKVLGPLKGHTSSVFSVAYSPDGTRIISGSWDNTIRMWDAQTGQTVLGPLKGHTGSVYSVAYSADGTRIISGSWDNTIRMWDAQTGQTVLGPLEGHTWWVLSVAFSPDGTRIISGSWDNTIRMWDAQTGQTVLGPLEGHTSSVWSVAFSPDGTRIISGSWDNTIRMWDAQTGQTALGPLEGHTSSVLSVAFSADGTRIISGFDDNTIRMWDAQTGQTVLGPLEGHTRSVRSVAFSPDGARIISGSCDNTIRMWDAQTGQTVLGPLEGHTSSVLSVAFSADGTRIISGSDDKTIRMWDAQTGQTVLGPLEGHTWWVLSVAFSPDGTRIISGSWDNTIRMWDAQTGQTALGPLEGHTSSVLSVAFSADGTRIISGSDDKTIRMWDAQTGQTVLGPLEGHTWWVLSVAFSPDGTRFISGSSDNTIRMWDVQTGQTVLGPLEGHTGSANSVAFSPDGTRIISGSFDNTIRMWDAQTGQTVLGPLEGHTSSVWSVAFSPDGTRIISGSFDNTIRMWDAQTGQTVLGQLEGHTYSVNSVAFSPDGTCIISGSNDNTIRMWDVRLGQPQLSDSSSGHLAHLTVNADGWAGNASGEFKPLVWIPADLRSSLARDLRLIHVIAQRPYLRLDFSGALIGPSWVGCYDPTL